MFFFAKMVIMFLALGFLNACLTSGPPVAPVFNTAPCKKNGSELVQVKTVTASNGKISIDMIMKLPCSTSNIDASQEIYSMAFYNANNLVIPKDLTDIQVKYVGADCKNASTREKDAKADSGTYVLDQGAGISFCIGLKSLNALHPLYLKYNIDNSVGTGTNCALSGSETSPFVIDNETYSPVYYNGFPVFGNSQDIDAFTTLYSKKLVTLGAPIYSYGILLNSDSGGIKGTAVTGGTEFRFDIRLKPGSYYIVFSQVKNFMSALSGNFSLQNPMVFSAGDAFISEDLGFKEYQKDCNKHIETCAKKYTVS